MPRVGEEQVFVTRDIASPRSPNRELFPKNTGKTPTSESAQLQPQGDAEERGQDRTGPSASNKRDQTNHRSRVTNISGLPLNVSQSSVEGRQAAETTKSDVRLSATSAAYLDYHVNKKLHHHKRRIVESLMDTIVECFEKKLDTLEEAREGGDGSGSGSSGHGPSRAPSSGFGSDNSMRPRAAGQKRQHRRDDGDEDNSHDDGDNNGWRKNHYKKKTKKICDDTRPKFACPFYQYDPQKFKEHRTCLGPGWTEVHRVKEHLKRRHRLPPHQCNRCLRPFVDEDQLKAHQRKEKPCPIKDPKTVPKDLAAGFDGKKWDQLQRRLKKTDEEKWKEWYCILFEVDASSSEIPSPYHDIPLTRGGKSSSDISDIRAFCRERFYPMIHYHVDREVQKAVQSVEDEIKANVKDVISALPRRIMASIQPHAQFSEEQAVVQFELLENLEFDFSPDEGFNFGEIGSECEPPLALSDPTLSSSWSDPAAPSSATSLQDDVPLDFCLGV